MGLRTSGKRSKSQLELPNFRRPVSPASSEGRSIRWCVLRSQTFGGLTSMPMYCRPFQVRDLSRPEGLHYIRPTARFRLFLGAQIFQDGLERVDDLIAGGPALVEAQFEVE